jgi:hypothetical protein
MGIVVPKMRKHLCADALLRSVQDVVCHIPEHRTGDANIPLHDALMSAFALFSLTAPSLLAFDKERTADHVQRVDGMGRVPCDTSMRATRDPMEPGHLRPAFPVGFRRLQRGKGLEEMVCVEGHSLLALAGTGYFSSKEIHCASCVEKHHNHGAIPSAHPLLGAALLHPDSREVIPLMPEPMVKQDSTEKNDCERNAATRFVTTFRQDPPPLQVIVTEERRSAHAPHIETLQDHHMHDLFGGKEGDHAFLCEQVAQAERAGRVTDYARDNRHATVPHRFRCGSHLPRNASHPDLRVHCIACWEPTADGTGHHVSWITDLRVNTGTVYQLMRGARARWRIEQEPFNPLKNQGDHVAHNFGHGAHHLSVGCATLRMLAFGVEHIHQRCCPLCQAAGAKWGRKRLLWEKRRASFSIDARESMRHLFAALCDARHKPTPPLASDSCS